MPNKIFRKINITKLKKFLKELPEILVKHTFLSFLSFLLLALILGSFSFYQYIALSQEAGVPVSKKVLCLDKEKYQGILEEWQNRQEKFKQASQKHFLDPFQEIRIETIEEPVIEE
ncbi:hypothetical protein KAS79_02530, partial [Candidatus Parcubacteria bacterium]|nr:hypothetical protein [Candidatus Parcubacteria bacterium]